MSEDLVLVSGATGYLGASTALAFLEAGFRVRGTARSERKAKEWNNKHSETLQRVGTSKLEWSIVPDIVAEGAFDEASKGVTIFVHTASPVSYNVTDMVKELLIPAIEGTRRALIAAHTSGTVRRFVYTSSFAAVLNYSELANNGGVGQVWSEENWNNTAYEEAATTSDPTKAYCASKSLAEKMAWDFVRDEKPAFSLTTICPSMIYGPPAQVCHTVADLNQSVKDLCAMMDVEKVPPTGFPVYIDVHDCAKMHFLAATKDVAKGQRYVGIARHFDNSQIVAVVRDAFPDQAHRFPKDEAHDPAPHFETDTEKTVHELGMIWTPFKDTMVEMAAAIFKLE